MNIDRTKFLLMTGALSASIAAASAVGCSSSKTEVNDNTGTGNGKDASVSSNDDGGTTMTSDDAGDDAADGSTITGDAGVTTDGATTCDDSVFTGADPCAADAGTADDAGNCLTAEPVYCDNIQFALKPKERVALANCLATLPICESAMQIDECITVSLQGACPDPAAVTACQGIATTCALSDGGTVPDGGATADPSCVSLLNALSPMARTQVTTCATEDGCATSVSDCMATGLGLP